MTEPGRVRSRAQIIAGDICSERISRDGGNLEAISGSREISSECFASTRLTGMLMH